MSESLELIQAVPSPDDSEALLPLELQEELNGLRQDQIDGHDWTEAKRTRLLELQEMADTAKALRDHPGQEVVRLSPDGRAELEKLHRMQMDGRDEEGNEWGPTYFTRMKELEAVEKGTK